MNDYEILEETEKAIKVKYPFYTRTLEYTKSHVQKYVIQWVPKSCANIEDFVKKAMTKRGFQMKYIFMGIAPKKIKAAPSFFEDPHKFSKGQKELSDKIFKKHGVEVPDYLAFYNNGCHVVDSNGILQDCTQEFLEYKQYILTKETRYKDKE